MKYLWWLVVLILLVGVSPASAYLAPSNNLSDMIRHSGPFNGVNPTTRQGEAYVPLPYQLNGVVMRWQTGHYRGGLYGGYLEKGDYVYAWVVTDCSEYTEYRLSRGRCGNPAKPVNFRREKPKLPAPLPPPPPPLPPPPPPEEKRGYIGSPTSSRPILLTPVQSQPIYASYNIGGSATTYRSLLRVGIARVRLPVCRTTPTNCTGTPGPDPSPGQVR